MVIAVRQKDVDHLPTKFRSKPQESKRRRLGWLGRRQRHRVGDTVDDIDPALP